MINLLSTKSGASVPYVGLGTFPFQGREMADVVKSAVDAGYRLFDTSDDYRGESGIGLAISELSSSKQVGREDLFIQTKISDNNAYADEYLKGVYFNPESQLMRRHSVEDVVREKVETSLYELQTTYIDSLLIHYPFPAYLVDIWNVMIQLRAEGIVRYIGVSNFHERHISQLIDSTGVAPQINEIYVSPIGTKHELVEYCNKLGILLMTYSPLMDVAAHRIPQAALHTMMKKYNKSLAQIVLRWNIERGCVPLPKTRNIARLKENLDIFDFSLTSEEVAQLSALDCGYQYLVESKICPGL